MKKLESCFLNCAGRNIHFLKGGNPENDCVVIWHGVTGTCRDHIELAEHLTEKYYVICPDAIGCGLSDWIQDRNIESGLTFYCKVARDLLRQLNIKECRWIGSSKGGGLGIILANIMTECPISHLVINDVGPGLPNWMRTAAMKNISAPPRFGSFLEFKQNLRETLSRGRLKLSDQQWQHLALNWSRRTDDGGVTFQNDPALAYQFTHHPQDFDLWPYYNKLTIPTLLIRGEYSIVDDIETEAMQSRGPRCKVYNRPGGHISLMNDRDEQNIILEFIAPKNFIHTYIGEHHEQSFG